MNKKKWCNFFGDICAIATVSSVYIAANHKAKKYGQKYKGFSIDKWYLIDYAANKFIGDGTNIAEKVGKMMANPKEKQQ